jgi:hypothetical protein
MAKLWPSANIYVLQSAIFFNVNAECLNARMFIVYVYVNYCAEKL